MVKYEVGELDAVFNALGDSTRRAILARLARGDTSVSELAAPFHVSLPAISKHLRVLERAGLLRQEKAGRVRRCRFVPEPMKRAAHWMEQQRRFWEQQFDALAGFLDKTRPEEASKWPAKRRKRKLDSSSKGDSKPAETKSIEHGPIRKR